MKQRIVLLLAVVLLCAGLAACSGSTTEKTQASAAEPSFVQKEEIPRNLHTPAASFAGGTGTQTDPYQIGDASQLALLAQHMSGNTSAAYGSACYVLTADIVLNDIPLAQWNGDVPVYSWEPIGGPSNIFSGTLDGNGHCISGMYIYEDATAQYCGLFARVSGTVKNLTIENALIHVNSGTYVGSVAGQVLSNGSVENCVSDALLQIGSGADAGGIAGQGGKITNCTFSGSLSQIDESWCHLGGIVGSQGTVIGCTNLGSITGYGYSGGIAGWSSNIDNCVNLGDIYGDTSGGIAGNMYKAGMGIEPEVKQYTIRSCTNEGTVSAITVAGGILGKLGNDEVDLTMHIIDCVNNGLVLCDAAIAGIVGTVSVERASAITVENCVNHAELTGKGKVAGIVCELKGAVLHQEGDFTISACINNGDLSSEDMYASGILTYFVVMGKETDLRVNILDCANVGSITSQKYAGGITCFTTAVSATGLKISDDSMVTIKGCANAAEISGLSSNSFVGGIAGNLGIAGMKTTVSDCTNSGTVTVDYTLTEEEIQQTLDGPVMAVSQMVGGIVGRIGEGLLLTTDHDNGDVSNVDATNPWIVLTDCHNTGILSATDYTMYRTAAGQQVWKNYIGGIVGDVCAEEEYSFAVKNCTYLGSDRGLGNVEYPDVGKAK